MSSKDKGDYIKIGEDLLCKFGNDSIEILIVIKEVGGCVWRRQKRKMVCLHVY